MIHKSANRIIVRPENFLSCVVIVFSPLSAVRNIFLHNSPDNVRTTKYTLDFLLSAGGSCQAVPPLSSRPVFLLQLLYHAPLFCAIFIFTTVFTNQPHTKTSGGIPLHQVCRRWFLPGFHRFIISIFYYTRFTDHSAPISSFAIANISSPESAVSFPSRS